MPAPPKEFRQQLAGAPPPVKRTRGRPRKQTPVETAEVDLPPPPTLAPEPALTGPDGMKYLLARFVHLFNDDPVALNRVLVDIRMAEQGKTPPRLIEVDWNTSRREWRAEYERIAGQNGGTVAPTPEAVALPQGRPAFSDLNWSDDDDETTHEGDD